jgi:riboflavin kinase / FMN adenylyltransferase
MIITHGTDPAPSHPVALTIGNFDGVHRGHEAIVARVRAVARERKLVSCVLTFEPHPREFFSPDTAPTRLTSMREKLELLSQLEIERVHVQRFTPEFAALSPDHFVAKVLVETLKARWILVGDDFRYGSKRAGNYATLRDSGNRAGFSVESIPTVADAGVRVSSSAVRNALAVGDIDRASTLLGRRYTISGRIIHGQKLGRELGYATANVELEHNRPPLFGIYAVRVFGIGEAVRNGVASLGYRPTVTNERTPTLEVHLFDFSADIYGMRVRVEFLEKIRDEEKFPDLETLKVAIAEDCIAARRVLSVIGND